MGAYTGVMMQLELTEEEFELIIDAFELVDGEYTFNYKQQELYDRLVEMRK
jgi:hypothetical protein